MSSTTDKIKGSANDAAGAVKKGLGKATGQKDLEAEGTAQQIKGKAQKIVGEAKDAVKKAID
ncbi:UPF0337 protein bsl2407 [Labrys miyagiensis]|uniref:UPF0337 protein bsl2407 n=1 Tax=Labrys miyagiensis TaxID=346912 RepID=A0ABQ6CQT5_9HYPH|nr:CsbD family protein [Labrys miyagiensis]GLS20592.1 UPF0337 protein bsl2407 [Labrys miyagiensis]